MDQEDLDFEGDILLTHDAIKGGVLDTTKKISFGVRMRKPGMGSGGGCAMLTILAWLRA